MPAQLGPGAPRKQCVQCSPKRARSKAPKTTAQPKAPSSSTGLLDATRKELTRAGQLPSHAGQAALLLAERIEFGENTGSAVAQMVRQLHDTMARALADQVAEADPLDELVARRERRRAGA